MPKDSSSTSNGGSKYASLRTGGGSAGGAGALAQVSAAKLQTMIVAVITLGDAVTFGTTRDGGAVAICLLSGKEIDKVYGADAEELEEALDRILAATDS